MNDHIYKRADRLSGGQRQRVGIARAIIQSPDFLLVDEPTSSLDIKIQHEVMDLIHKIMKEDGMPVLISIHNVELAKEYADRVIGLQDGKKVFEGTATEVDKKALDTIYKYD
jgi:phosphonate transport system ATP-binding protein